MSNELKTFNYEQVSLFKQIKECEDVEVLKIYLKDYFKLLKDQYLEHDVAYSALNYIESMKEVIEVVNQEAFPFAFNLYFKEISAFEHIYAKDEMLNDLMFAYHRKAQLCDQTFIKINYLTKSNHIIDKVKKVKRNQLSLKIKNYQEMIALFKKVHNFDQVYHLYEDLIKTYEIIQYLNHDELYDYLNVLVKSIHNPFINDKVRLKRYQKVIHFGDHKSKYYVLVQKSYEQAAHILVQIKKYQLAKKYYLKAYELKCLIPYDDEYIKTYELLYLLDQYLRFVDQEERIRVIEMKRELYNQLDPNQENEEIQKLIKLL